jgi:2-octaprenyl-6-methoxyphenol hydroxylase
MAPSRIDAVETCDVFVVGAGLTGLTAAIGFARAGRRVVSAGATERLGRGRTVALLGPSVEFLDQLGAWPAAAARAAPMRGLRIVDDTGSLFAPPPIAFRAREIGRDVFGWNVENAALADALAASAAALPNLVRMTADVAGFDFAPGHAAVTLADGRVFVASLVVGADGRASPSRRSAGIATRERRYAQSALTVLIAHARPHDDFSTEFHTRQGPFTLVPLPAAPGAPHRSSLVWAMSEAEAKRRAALDDDALAAEIERQARSLLGAMRIEGERGLFPLARQSVGRLAATRLALVGDAAHAFPPIGAQGLNLGLRDVAALIAAATASDDLGADAALDAYARSRAADVLFRTTAVAGLNRSLLADCAPVDLARGLGLAALGAIGPLRRLAMRQGVAPLFAQA